MKTLVAAAFTVASLTVAPMPAFASNAVAMACGESVPEEWKRPGGYCDQIGGGGSLSTPTTNSFECPVLAGLTGTDRLLLAAAPAQLDACGNPVGCVVAPEEFLMPADRGRLLYVIC